MRVLMLGWEFPPYKSGGLGTACYDLTKGLSNQDVQVTFVMPKTPEGANAEFVKLVGANQLTGDITINFFSTLLQPYMTPEQYDAEYTYHTSKQPSDKELYGANMYAEIERYKAAICNIIKTEPFDIIHAHDWMTYEAGVLAKELSGKPLVIHLHATEGDRTAGHPNTWIAEKEAYGFTQADRIIANSNWTKSNIMKEYSVNAEKINVVHWGIRQDNPAYRLRFRSALNKKDKIVLSLGRITIQKGIDYLVRAAAHVVKHVPNVKFVIVGKGDKLGEIIGLVSDLGLSDKFIFPGWLKGAEVHQAFQMADVFVMPSVSEPFGLVALESLKNNTPIIISKQSGASEVVQNALKVDFWDVHALADKLVGVLKYPQLHEILQKRSYLEAFSFDLDTPAKKCIEIYESVLAKREAKL
ncbi:glycosyltransferase [Candidatus Woesearchaeota archaeon]|nr:glycosyltransferase [Candidatus Woesearchaeota archaeon]